MEITNLVATVTFDNNNIVTLRHSLPNVYIPHLAGMKNAMNYANKSI